MDHRSASIYRVKQSKNVLPTIQDTAQTPNDKVTRNQCLCGKNKNDLPRGILDEAVTVASAYEALR
jgi:hypothetical protein